MEARLPIRYLFFITLRVFLVMGGVLSTSWLNGQELNAKVIINTDLMPVNVEKRIFSKLEVDLQNFLNNTRWSKDNYDFFERIDCNLVLNLEQVIDNGVFTASLIVQATRPVFNTVYAANMLNMTDREIIFQYQENQSLEFNENRIQTTNPLFDNLTAIFSFYAYLIVGLDNTTMAHKGGASVFQRLMNVVNNAPEHKYINGWNPFNSRRNRYWIGDALSNSNLIQLHDVYYGYYRDGLDKLSTDPKNAKMQILKALNLLSTLAAENQQNLAFVPLFIQGKTEELINIFKTENEEIKAQFLSIIEKLDAANMIKYKRSL